MSAYYTSKRKIRVGFSLCLVKYHAIVTWGKGCIAPYIHIHAHNLSSGWRRAISFIPCPHTLGTIPQYPLDRKLGGWQSKSTLCQREKSLAYAGNLTPVTWLSACDLVTIPSELMVFREIFCETLH